MFPHEREALAQAAERLKSTLVERIVSVYAFGSRVRGDHHGWSDLDILVIVEDKTPELEREIISLFADKEMESGVPFSVVIKDVKCFEMEKKYKTPFYSHIAEEGVSI